MGINDKTKEQLIEELLQRISELEEQLQQVQKMESIGTLTGGIAHDFNNILGVNSLCIYLLKRRLGEDQESADILDDMEKSTRRAADLVDQILTFSRKGVQERQEICIGPIVKETLKMLRATITTSIEIKHNISQTSNVMADPTQLHQIILNFCTNAFHAMQEAGGTMEVDLQDVNVTPDFASDHIDLRPGPYVKLLVSDTGSGMDALTISRIFEPYFTTKERGTGLGLSVTHGIVKSYGGAILVSSELSRGTTFQIFFPVAETHSKQECEVEETLIQGTERILFVDDEKSIVSMGKMILEDMGYKVTGVTDSLEALEIFRENGNKFDVVFTDMNMPKMTGLKLAQEISKVQPDIPIILSTGFSEGITEEGIKRYGINELIMKPFSPEKFTQTIQKVLKKEA